VPPPEDIVQKQRSADGDEHACKTEDMDGASWASSEESMAVGEAMLGERDRRRLKTCVAATRRWSCCCLASETDTVGEPARAAAGDEVGVQDTRL
jgi:hypothetical protein